MKQKVAKSFIGIAIIIGLLVLLWVIYPFFNSALLKNYALRAGIWGPVVLIIYVIISHVFAPLGGIPALVVGASLFGVPLTIFYIYLAGLISAPINFFISRKFGRDWVLKLAGKKVIKKIDEITFLSGKILLIVGRVFGSAMFEEISYAFGLTSMSLKEFFFITVFASAVPTIFLSFFFRDVDFSKIENTLILLSILFLAGVLFSFYLYRLSTKAKVGRE